MILLLPALAILVPASVAHASAPSRPTAAGHLSANANPAILTDPTGDNGAAPDITSIEVANDASGYIAFQIGMTRRPTRADMRVVVAIDSDQNTATGFEGSDYLLLAAPATGSYGLARWDGTQFVDSPETTLSEEGGVADITFSINRSELGNTAEFNFWARTVQGPTFAAGHYDSVPDTGSSSYALGVEPDIHLSVERSHAGTARSGKDFVALIVVTRSDILLADVTVADVTCAASVGGRALAATMRDGLGPAAGCLWRMPKKSHGKLLRASVAVTLDGVTVMKRFAERIK